MKYRTATIYLANGSEVSLTLGYIVFWTGEDFEVTVFDPEAPDSETPEFIDRFIVSSDTQVFIESRVDAILRKTLKDQLDQYIVVTSE